MIHKDPYVKSNDGEAATPSAQELDMGAVVPPAMACEIPQKSSEVR